MMHSFFYLIHVALIALLLSGCNVSLQSSQFNFIKGLFAQDLQTFEKNWQVHWRGKLYPVFAVNHDGGTFFADDGGFMVFFDGWQIRQVSNSQSKGGKVVVIEKTTADDGVISLDYTQGNARLLARHECQAWERISSTGWKQNCKSANSADAIDAEYTNTIELTANGELVALRFMVLPGTDLMQISLKQLPPQVGNDQGRKSQYE